MHCVLVTVCSDVDSTQFWLMMKSLNYCPKCCWSSRVPLCSVRVTEVSFGNKYGLCLLAGDLRLLLLSQVTSEVVCKGVEKVSFYNGKSKCSLLKMSDSPWKTCRKETWLNTQLWIWCHFILKLQECILSLTLIIKCGGVYNTLTIYPRRSISSCICPTFNTDLTVWIPIQWACLAACTHLFLSVTVVKVNLLGTEGLNTAL